MFHRQPFGHNIRCWIRRCLSWTSGGYLAWGTPRSGQNARMLTHSTDTSHARSPTGPGNHHNPLEPPSTDTRPSTTLAPAETRARHHDAIGPAMTTNQHSPWARVPVNRYAPPHQGHPTAEPHGANPGALLPRGNSGPASDVGSSGRCAYQVPRAARVPEASSR